MSEITFNGLNFGEWFDYVYEPEKYVVYGMYDFNDYLLYVGITALHGLRHRMRSHVLYNPWVKQEVHRLSILSEHSTPQAARLAESDAIVLLNPEYNKTGKVKELDMEVT